MHTCTHSLSLDSHPSPPPADPHHLRPHHGQQSGHQHPYSEAPHGPELPLHHPQQQQQHPSPHQAPDGYAGPRNNIVSAPPHAPAGFDRSNPASWLGTLGTALAGSKGLNLGASPEQQQVQVSLGEGRGG